MVWERVSERRSERRRGRNNGDVKRNDFHFWKVTVFFIINIFYFFLLIDMKRRKLECSQVRGRKGGRGREGEMERREGGGEGGVKLSKIAGRGSTWDWQAFSSLRFAVVTAQQKYDRRVKESERDENEERKRTRGERSATVREENRVEKESEETVIVLLAFTLTQTRSLATQNC